MKKFYSEFAYIIGIMSLAIGTALAEKAAFGMSMVVAPAYILYLKLSQTFSFFTFGMAEYIFQALLLIVMMSVLRRFRTRYLFAFATTVFYGLLLDISMLCVAAVPAESIYVRVLFYILSTLCCAFGVALLFHTYIPPEVYELFVKEISAKFGFNIHRCKTVYDCVSCVTAIIMSFVLFGFGHFEGVKWGTVINALVNGAIIGFFSSLLEKHFVFDNLLHIGESKK